MPSSFTSNKDIEKPAPGEQQGTWGGTANRNYDKIDANLSRVLDLSIVANQTLTTSQSAVSQSDSAVINLTGNIGATSVTRTLTFPSGRTGLFIVDATEVIFGSSRVRLIGDVTDSGITLASVTDRVIHVYSNGTSVRRVDEKSTSNVPIIGEVKMYAPPGGTIVSANLPFGWHVANGNSGTADLRGRFIRAASVASQTGNTGGNSTRTFNNTTTGTITSTVLTSANLPRHSHGIFANDAATGGVQITSRNQTAKSGQQNTTQGADFSYSIYQSTAVSANAPNANFVGTTQVVGNTVGGTAAHTHTFVPTSANVTVSTVPPFYSLVFLQYTGA